MKLSSSIATAGLFAAGSSAAAVHRKRETTFCGQYDTAVSGIFTLYNNLWGEAEATSGSQCTTLISQSGDTISWSTSYTWAGGDDDVKSYASAVADLAVDTLASITSIPTTWDWSYSGSDLDADVSYDMFTSSSADGANEYEIMVWLATYGGAGPISSTGTAIATPTIDGSTWKLYSGPNGDTTVYSFVAETDIESFTGDLKLFLEYLVTDEGLSSAQYLTYVGAGTEPFIGTDAVFTTSTYTISLDT